MNETIRSFLDSLTDPHGVGLPILIGAGLAVILFLMNSATKSWGKADAHLKQTTGDKAKSNLPYKPF